jgi:hypothetical protein
MVQPRPELGRDDGPILIQSLPAEPEGPVANHLLYHMTVTVTVTVTTNTKREGNRNEEIERRTMIQGDFP